MAGYDKFCYDSVKTPILNNGEDLEYQNNTITPKTKNPFLFPGYTALHYKMIFSVTTYYTMEWQSKITSPYRNRWLGNKPLFNKEMSQALDNYIELFSSTIFIHVMKLAKLNESDTPPILSKLKLFQKYYYTAVINLYQMGLLKAIVELYRIQCQKTGLTESGQYIAYDISPNFCTGDIDLWIDFWYDAFKIFICWVTEKEKINELFYIGDDENSDTSIGQDSTDNS